MSCAKKAELIDLSFGLWTRLDRQKHEFNRIRQVAPACTSSIIIVFVFVFVLARWEGTFAPFGEYD